MCTSCKSATGNVQKSNCCRLHHFKWKEITSLNERLFGCCKTQIPHTHRWWFKSRSYHQTQQVEPVCAFMVTPYREHGLFALFFKHYWLKKTAAGSHCCSAGWGAHSLLQMSEVLNELWPFISTPSLVGISWCLFVCFFNLIEFKFDDRRILYLYLLWKPAANPSPVHWDYF